MIIEDLKLRRTIRKYKNDQIPEKMLNELLEVAFRASTTGNMQLYSVIVTRDEENKKKLAPAHFNQPTVTTAPVVLTFYTATIDALLVAQQFCTAAELCGLGICYLGTTTYNAPMIIEALNLPKFVVPVTTVTVGYPAEIPAQVDRLPAEALIHDEQYKDYTSEDIDRIYAEKESLPESKKYITENNKETLAQVFTDVRYPKANNEHFSDIFLKIIREQGFQF